MIIPDCRTDEIYNQKYLKADDARFIQGFDFAVQEMLSLFDNLGAYPDVEELLDDKKAILKEGKAELMRDALDEWVEMSRDEMITSMLDGYGEDEFQKIKEAVDNGTGRSTETHG